MRTVGTVVRGIRAPIVRQGDDLVSIVTDSVLSAASAEGFALGDRDVVAVTESVVARAAGNYATVDHIAADVKAKFGGDTIGVIYPILSRNRFSVVLRGIAKSMKKIVLMLSYPADEVGNRLFHEDLLDEKGVNPWSDVLTEAQYRDIFGYGTHPFTGVDYVQYYRSLIEESGCEAEIIFSNRISAILKYTSRVLTCDIHTRAQSKRRLAAAGAEVALGLDDILTGPVNGSGYNEAFGLLGSNKASDDQVKLFPRNSQAFAEALQESLVAKTGKQIECMVYGDGAFKDPVGGIWELADPVVSPGYTQGLSGTPSELKLKYLADSDFADLSGDDLTCAIKASIQAKSGDLKGSMVSEGTTPRRITDLIGSLCDLTSGSGDKGTPVILIQGYFDNYAQEC